MNPGPYWICLACAYEREDRWPDGQLSTWHRGRCGVCRRKRNVTAISNWRRKDGKDVERTLMLLPVLSGLYADTQVTAKRKLDRLRRIMSGDEKIPDGLWQGEEGSAAVGQTVGNFTVTEVR